MSDFPRWKYALVALVMLFGVIYALPNAFPPVPAVQVTANRDAPPIDQSVQQKVTAALTAKNIAVTRVFVEGDHLLATFVNSDVQKSGADAIKAALGDGYTVAFKLQSNVPGWLGAIGARAMPLGLDLQGGVHFLMQVDQKDAIEKQENSYADDIRALLRDKNIRYESVTRNAAGGQGIAVILRSADDRSTASDAIANEYTDLLVSSGASTGDRYVLNVTVKPEKLRELSRSAITQNLGTLRNRINALGVSEPLIQQQGDSRIVVELAGVQDPTEAKKLIGAVATLQYRPGIGQPGDPRAAEAARTGNIPPDANLYYMRGSNLPVLVSKQIIVTGNQLVDASSGIDQQSGTPKVDVTLNAAGAKKMGDFTNANVGKPMAVLYVEQVYETKVIDGKEVRVPKVTETVINDATIQSPFSRQFQTTGLGSPKEASDLALLLKGGALAAPMDIVEEGVIGASLGQDNIDKGFKAVLLGLALVLLAAAIYYKLFGLVADIALFFNLVILVAVMSLIGVTLTMPGVAGIVLTLGMAIDANVLICERVREELRNGSSPHAAIRAGYEKAWSTILDANVTHLIAALALTTMGTGAIKGFGVTLMIGILTSLFTSVTLTHAFTAAIHGHRKLKTLSV
ncbi:MULTISPECIES: protein translocase subunit SecD [unclassified Rhodanobacter]|uniref:protein translocase subunit SecD n=1 Tax=unclassified Rhodanobacter TaxID=2621553 RepID=UPI0007AA238E|nr:MULTISPECIES: protein translocase subunit SecD [unclassified Rhodanobacter]KZC16496.1 preprotein translocase subunit SecD [Rhodanobacter sp. FW104-R8]KZC28864.1 preprotein translocase subunit SecD [Rhodanobacter sp. FW510-T8]KZC31510.1 preprotein translocase subunit SecD [Rhodanobacter sp. FW510-R10]